MNLKSKINLLDCTLRDGGYYNNWDFSRRIYRNYFNSIKNTKIEAIEIGFRFPQKNFYTFDTCIKDFKESKRYTFIKDMQVNYLTGLEENGVFGRKERQAKRQARREERKEKREKRREEGKGFFQGAKKIALSVPRNAFRSLVSLNVRGLATKLNKAIAKDSNKVKSFWEKLGGKFDKLQESINTGKNKKPLFGSRVSGLFYEEDEYIGAIDPATVTLITSASAVLIPALALIKSLAIPKERGEEGTEDIITPEEISEAEASGNKITDPNFIATDNENTSGMSFKPSPMLIGGLVGAGLLVYFLTKKKR
jgi:hypothetical protein